LAPRRKFDQYFHIFTGANELVTINKLHSRLNYMLISYGIARIT